MARYAKQNLRRSSTMAMVGGHQRTQGRVHVAQVQVQLTADAVHGAFGHGGNPFFLGQNMLGGH